MPCHLIGIRFKERKEKYSHTPFMSEEIVQVKNKRGLGIVSVLLEIFIGQGADGSIREV